MVRGKKVRQDRMTGVVPVQTLWSYCPGVCVLAKDGPGAKFWVLWPGWEQSVQVICHYRQRFELQPVKMCTWACWYQNHNDRHLFICSWVSCLIYDHSIDKSQSVILSRSHRGIQCLSRGVFPHQWKAECVLSYTEAKESPVIRSKHTKRLKEHLYFTTQTHNLQISGKSPSPIYKTTLKQLKTMKN